MGFSRTELERFRGVTVPDLVRHSVRLLFVGINPGLWTAAVQTHFAHPANRFYPALHEGGVVDWRIDPSGGMTEDDRRRFTDRGLGITNIVARATARASELSVAELRDGAMALEARVEAWRPTIVAVAGITAYRTGFGRPKAATGPQDHRIGGAQVWAVPNPSGLNAHETVSSLARWYRKAAVAAGVISE
jgi:TDG/mug DNA glycosylase family protein